MNLSRLVDRTPVIPWSGASKIPWDEPGFSARMLDEHLDPSHGAASRPFALIDRQVDWIHRFVLNGKPQRLLDLGCGPGFYTQRLQALGHECLGIDFSPASISYARAQKNPVEYRQADIRDGGYGVDFRAALLLFGEFNAFSSEDARGILQQVHAALIPGGKLVIEPHTQDYLRGLGERAPYWYSSGKSVFSARPHVCLRESAWHETECVSTDRYFVFEDGTPRVCEYVNTLRAYSDGDLEELLTLAGFDRVSRYPSLTGEEHDSQPGLSVYVAER